MLISLYEMKNNTMSNMIETILKWKVVGVLGNYTTVFCLILLVTFFTSIFAKEFFLFMFIFLSVFAGVYICLQIYLAIKNPDSLRSDEYHIQQQKLQIIGDSGNEENNNLQYLKDVRENPEALPETTIIDEKNE